MSSAEEAHRVREGLNRAVYANHLGEVLETYAIDCVLDVGAYRGEYGRLLRGIGYEGRIVSFEPVAESFAELERSLEAQPPWSGHRLALGERGGEAEITVFEGGSFSALVEPTSWAVQTFPDLRRTGTETVPLRRLDDLVPELVRDRERVLLKVDVQGSEWQVLAGAAETLRRVEAAQVEASVLPVYEGVKPYAEVLDHLRDSGLEPSGLFPVSRDPHLRLIELDCILVRAGREG